MSEQNTADNWRLEDTGDTLDQWKLQETEQNQAEQWQLQRVRSEEVGWQPVDYERQSARRGSWALPLLVGLALVAVFAYGVWIGLGTLGITDISSLIAPGQSESTPAAVAAADLDATATAMAAAPTAEPTATATIAPTDTPPPAPSPTPEPIKVEQQIVRITNQYGVNARREPSTDGELVQVLQQSQEFVVTEDRGDGWLQVALPSAELVWISSDYAEKRSELVPLEIANQRRAALKLPPLTAADAFTDTEGTAVAAIPTPVVGTQPITGTQAMTETASVSDTTPTTPTESLTNTPVLTAPAPSLVTAITGTVNITAGLNARSEPTTTAQAVILLNGGDVLTITGRSADSQWLQVRLADGATAWVFAEYVDISTTSVPAPLAAPGASTPVTPTTGTGSTSGGASASVKSLSGANARLAPDRNAESAKVIAYDTVLTIRGRTANNEWLQVEYEGQLVWVLVSTVSLSADLATLPVVTP